MKTKKAIIIGASGLVGSHILASLLENPNYSEIAIFTRKKIDLEHPKLNQVLVDFDNLNKNLIQADEIFCAIGTTLKKAGSKSAQLHIDCEIPYNFAKIGRENGVKGFYLVSSLGADANSTNFYLKTKGQLEQKITELKFETFVSVRPSILFGNRTEKRLGEGFGIFAAKLIEPFLLGKLKKYAGIEAADVAEALIKLANSNKKGDYKIESDELKKMANN